MAANVAVICLHLQICDGTVRCHILGLASLGQHAWEPDVCAGLIKLPRNIPSDTKTTQANAETIPRKCQTHANKCQAMSNKYQHMQKQHQEDEEVSCVLGT